MKKLFAKLALFTFASIILIMPVYALEERGTCITSAEKKAYIITVVEEAFGAPTGTTTSEYQSRMCCRQIKIADDGTKDPELNKAVNAAEGQTCPSPCPDNEICDEVMVILSKGGTTMIEGYIASLYTWAASLVGLISVTVIIISGIQIALSGGDTQAVDSGKSRIIKSLSGLAVLFLSGLILYTINPNFFTHS